MADLVILDPDSWLFAGTGLAAGQHLPRVVQGEFDRYVPGAGQSRPTVDVIAHSVVPNRGNNFSDVTWYTVPRGGGRLRHRQRHLRRRPLQNSTLVPPNVVPDATPGVTAPLLRMMENLYSVIAMGPASLTQPSQGTWQVAYAPGSAGIKAPTPNNAA